MALTKQESRVHMRGVVFSFCLMLLLSGCADQNGTGAPPPVQPQLFAIPDQVAAYGGIIPGKTYAAVTCEDVVQLKFTPVTHGEILTIPVSTPLGFALKNGSYEKAQIRIVNGYIVQDAISYPKTC